MSLCAVLRPSLTPVLSLTVTGMSPNARFMPTTILPNLPAASRTMRGSGQPGTAGEATCRPTGRAAASLVHQIDWAAAIHVDKVEVACALLADDLCRRHEQLGLAACDLHAEDRLGGVSADEGPLFLRALKERHRETH